MKASIAENFRRIRDSIPEHVTLVPACKTRTAQEVLEVIEAGATDLGENYVQETERKCLLLGEKAAQVRWHMIGHLQKNKINKALRLFDVIETVDSLSIARAIDERAAGLVCVYLEVNIAGEQSKFGAPLDEVPQLLEDVSSLRNLRIVGLMTMEPYLENPENARPYFRRMKGLFDELKAAGPPNVEMQVLSMGMTSSYRVAIEEGSTMVRIGTAIFGPRGG